MVRLLAVAVAVALLSPAAGQAVRQPADEFSLLDLPRPSAMLSGFPMMNLGRLLDGFEKTADLQQGEGAGPVGGVVRVIRLPPALSSLLGGAPQPQPEERPVVRMHIGLPFMLGSAGLSRPLQELRSLASGCVPCGRAQTVQSHMRSVSVMHGPDGQRVETVTETGPDGEEHTTRTVTQDGDESDLDLDDVMSAVMGGMPDFERIMDDIEGVQADAQPAKVAARVAEAPKQVSADDAKSAVETALAANGLELGSSEKRQDLAASIAEKLGVSPSSVKVTAQGDGGDVFEDEDEEDEDENEDAETAEVVDSDSDKDDAAEDEPDLEVDDEGEDEDVADEEEPPAAEDEADDDAEDADELGKEFENEEQERQSVLRQEEQTKRRVARAAKAASDKAEEQKQIAEQLNKLENHISGVLA